MRGAVRAPAAGGVRAAGLPFTGDEASFTWWGRNPDWGFYDHPPMVGWWLAALLAVSDAEWWLRLPMTLQPAVLSLAVGAVAGVFITRGTPWQFLQDHQDRRVDTLLQPAAAPLGPGLNIMQAKIALGSGGWSGKGFMQGTQSRLNFLPEKHTDFIFTTLAEEFGFIGAFSLLLLYALIIGFCLVSAMQNRDRFSSLLIIGVAANFFFYLAVNLSMVMGMAPVVGVPLPLLSSGGSAMLVILAGFGLVQNAHVHRPRQPG